MSDLAQLFKNGDSYEILKLQTVLYVLNQERSLNNDFLVTRQLCEYYQQPGETIDQTMTRLFGLP